MRYSPAPLNRGQNRYQKGNRPFCSESSRVILRRLPSLALCLVSLLFAPPSAMAQEGLPAKPRIEAALAAPVFKNALVGVLVKSLDDGRVVYEHNPDFSLMPASNMKILTGATAAMKLPATFHYTTTLYRTRDIDRRGELKGDLYIKGSGDPSLTSADLLALVQTLKTLGVKKFNGKIIADSSVFDDKILGDGWQWDNEPFYYQAQVSGLNCDENVVTVVVSPGTKVGDAATVTMGENVGKTRYLSLQNTAVTVAADAKTDVNFDRTRAKNETLVSGTVALGGKPATEEITVEDPALFTATRLWEQMQAAGIRVPKPEKQRVERGSVPKETAVLAAHDSGPLPKLLADFLKPSDNLFGECLLKTLAAQKNGVGTTEGGRGIVSDMLIEMGVDTSGLVMADGSGLSRNDNVTPRLLVSLLTAVEKKFPTEMKAAFVDGLPVGGVDGTLRNRFKGTAAQGSVHAKTGSLTGASSLSGYLTTKAGEHLVFSILMNHYTSGGPTAQARAAQDAIVLALTDVPKP